MPSGPLDLDISSCCKRSITPSSVHNKASGQGAGTMGSGSSSWVSGGRAILKQLWKNLLSTFTFFLSSVIVSEPALHERVGTRDAQLPFRDLMADQNYLVFGALTIDVLLFHFSNFTDSLVSQLRCLYLWPDKVSISDMNIHTGAGSHTLCILCIMLSVLVFT